MSPPDRDEGLVKGLRCWYMAFVFFAFLDMALLEILCRIVIQIGNDLLQPDGHTLGRKKVRMRPNSAYKKRLKYTGAFEKTVKTRMRGTTRMIYSSIAVRVELGLEAIVDLE